MPEESERYMSLTEALRYRYIISQVGDFRLPFGAWTIPQLGFFSALVGIMVFTRGLWTPLVNLPQIAHFLLILIVPFTAAQLLGLVNTDGGRNPIEVFASFLWLIISETVRRTALSVYYGRNKVHISQFVRSVPLHQNRT